MGVFFQTWALNQSKMHFLKNENWEETHKFGHIILYLELDQWRSILPVTGRVSHSMDDTPTKNMHVVGYPYHHQRKTWVVLCSSVESTGQVSNQQLKVPWKSHQFMDHFHSFSRKMIKACPMDKLSILLRLPKFKYASDLQHITWENHPIKRDAVPKKWDHNHPYHTNPQFAGKCPNIQQICIQYIYIHIIYVQYIYTYYICTVYIYIYAHGWCINPPRMV